MIQRAAVDSDTLQMRAGVHAEPPETSISGFLKRSRSSLLFHVLAPGSFQQRGFPFIRARFDMLGLLISTASLTPRLDFGEAPEMAITAKQTAPRHLRSATRRWWLDVVGRWELEEHHRRLLTRAAESWDRGEQARKQIDREGLTTVTRDGGCKLHPAVRVESDCRLAFARLIRELDLDLDAPPASSRPAPLRSVR